MLARGGWQRAFALRQHQLRRHVVSSRSRSLLALGLRSSLTQLPLTPPPLGSVGLATHTGGRRPPPPSFAIAEAFTSDTDDDSDVYEDSDADDEGEESDSDDDRRRPVVRRSRHSNSVSRYSRSTDTDANRPSAAFLEALENKKRWLNTLAAQRDFASLVQSVVDCYKPLYAQRPSLADAVTPQLPPLIDAHVTTAKYQPQRFNDAVTKATEQEVLSLLVVARQGPLAAAVFEHRRALAQHLQTSPMVLSSVATGDQDDDSDTAEVLDLSHHFRSFYSFGMGAYSLLNAHATNIALYDEVVAAEAAYPTANMNASYLKALLTTRQPPADVRAFYADVATHSRPTNVFFYRQMLFFASAQHDGSLALQLLDDMKMKGHKLRSEDYLLAIRTYDDRYYFTPRTTPTTTTSRNASTNNRKHSDKATTTTRTTPLDTHTTPLDTYTSCVARFREQEDAPEQFQDLDGATHTVVALFEEMVDDERLVPHSDHFFPRVIAAAVYAREFRKAVAFVALFDEIFGGGAERDTSGETDDGATSTLHNAGVRMAVNAFLLLDEPDEAWAFVRRVCGPRLEPRDFAHVANVVEYLCVHKDGARLVRLLQDLQALGLLPLVSNSTVKTLLPALVHPASGLSDDALYDAVVARFAAVFHVRTKPHAYSQFLNECVYRKRLVLAKRMLQERDERRVGVVKVRLALRVVRACAEETADDSNHDNKNKNDILALVPEVFKATDLTAATPDEVAELCYAVIRANRRLGRSDEGSKRLFARHVQPLVARGTLSDVPEDIQSFAK